MTSTLKSWFGFAVFLVCSAVGAHAAGQRATIRGEVVSEDGQPVAGAQVELTDPEHPQLSHGGAPRMTARTGPDGRFTLDVTVNLVNQGLSEAHLEAMAVARDFALAREPVQLSARLGAEVHLRIALVRGVAVSGTLLNEAGQPVPGAYLLCSDSLRAGLLDPTVREGQGSTYSDEQGRWEIRGLAPGAHPLLVQAKDQLELFATVQAPGSNLTLRLASGAQLSGVVLSEDYEPLAGMKVSLRHAGGLLWPPLPSGETGEDGRFDLLGVPDGDYVVEAHQPRRNDAPVGQEQRGTFAHLQVRGGHAEPVRLQLEAGLSIGGQVLGPKGEPLAGVAVIAKAAPNSPPGEERFDLVHHAALTGPDGRFQVAHLPAGTYQLQLKSPSHRFERPVTAQAGARDVAVQAQAKTPAP